MPLAIGLLVAMGWLWSMALLLTRVHMVWTYVVTADVSGPADCFLPLLIVFLPHLSWVLFAALGVGWMAARAQPIDRWRWTRLLLCVVGFWMVPVLELIRLVWPSLPRTFLEPIGLAFLTGLVVKDFARGRLSKKPSTVFARSVLWFSAVVLAALALGVWWFWQSHQAYADYCLGYFDFGHFARRVINTWRGVGFLQQTPGLPAFWDHFNPGLAMLAPLWGLWSDVHLFFAVQALCLTLPAVFVYGIARRLGATAAGASAWALGYLAWPVVEQLNLNFSYGWHPVSAAIPLMLAAAYCLVSKRKAAALLLAVLACSFKEDVLVTTVGLAAGLALLAWLEKRAKREKREKRSFALSGPKVVGDGFEVGAPHPQPSPAFAWLPAPWVSLVVAGSFLAVAVLIFKTTDFTRYQVGRFEHLGNNVWEIAVSPFLHPWAFWSRVFSSDSLYYLLILFLPFGLLNAVRGWPLQLAVAVPLTLLLAWHISTAKCIAFQYVTCPIIVIAWAAMVGARRSAAARANPAAAMGVAGAAALATALCMSLVFGALPTTPPTSPFYVHEAHRPLWDPHVRELDRLVAMINRPDTSVLASGRVASHLLTVRRLEPLSDALDRKDLLAREAGPGKTWMDVFEWVLVDRTDTGQFERPALDAVIVQFLQAGYEIRYDNSEVILLHRPSNR
jgi:uncharacterized membrane protein